MIGDVPITPVQIGWGDFSSLETVGASADCLMLQWPAPTNSDAYLTALMVCDAMLAGSEDDVPEDVRAAFIEAVHEADLTLMDDDDGQTFKVSGNPAKLPTAPSVSYISSVLYVTLTLSFLGSDNEGYWTLELPSPQYEALVAKAFWLPMGFQNPAFPV